MADEMKITREQAREFLYQAFGFQSLDVDGEGNEVQTPLSNGLRAFFVGATGTYPAIYIPGSPAGAVRCTAALLRAVADAVEETLPVDANVQNKDSLSDFDGMVRRFLGWRLPPDFGPDGGVSFKAPSHPSLWPSGTNLLTYDQAVEMLRHVLGGDA